MERVQQAIRQTSSSNFVIEGVDFPAVEVDSLAEAVVAEVAFPDLVVVAVDSPALAAASLAGAAAASLAGTVKAVVVAVVVVMVIEDQGRIRT